MMSVAGAGSQPSACRRSLRRLTAVALAVALSLSAALATIPAAVSAAACSNPQVRREWNELSDSDKASYIAAVKKLIARPISGQYTDPSKISYYDFTITHADLAYWAHNNVQFFAYHRAMVHIWDLAMQSVGWTGGALYWDWTKDSQDLYQSSVFDAKYFGTGGQGPNNCVKDGAFSYDQYSVSPHPETVDYSTATPYQRGVKLDTSESYAATCLRRCNPSPDPTVKDTTWSAEGLVNAMSSAAISDFTGFDLAFDSNGPHAVIHSWVGGKYPADDTVAPNGVCGDMAAGAYSPNDPIFYLHHGMMDKMWYLWQKTCPSFATAYSGQLNTNNGANPDSALNAYSDNAAAYDAQLLDSWAVPVAEVLSTTGGYLCYTYSSSNIDTVAMKYQGTCPGLDESDHWLYTIVKQMSGMSESAASAHLLKFGSAADLESVDATDLASATAVVDHPLRPSVPANSTSREAASEFLASQIIATDPNIVINPDTGYAECSLTSSIVDPADSTEQDLLRACPFIPEGHLRMMNASVALERALEAQCDCKIAKVNDRILNGTYTSGSSLRSANAFRAKVKSDGL
ncbi:hypothetical protein DFJ73DRAFT_13247 [Zopfochytrium polystomum]|nr:hypothetical protein DFJ73DRAFT_13247 [Zopfochytrium polystomum]